MRTLVMERLSTRGGAKLYTGRVVSGAANIAIVLAAKFQFADGHWDVLLGRLVRTSLLCLLSRVVADCCCRLARLGLGCRE